MGVPIMRITVKSLILNDLGYCCLWFFFSRYKGSARIAERLGVSARNVRALRASCENCTCEHAPKCLQEALHLARKEPSRDMPKR